MSGVDRTAGGRRRYTPGDLGWLELVSCLRGTGMPIREMQEFARLLREGDDNFPERRALLEAHKERVERHIAELHEQMRLIDRKISFYSGQAVTTGEDRR